MKVLVFGLRGFPGVEGGVESHAEHLYPRLVERGVEVEVLARSPYQRAGCDEFLGVRLRRLWAPRIDGVEALLHSFLGAGHALVQRPDLVHVHGIGPGLVVPLLRMFGLCVIVTHHGRDYEREKWGWVARAALRFGEWAVFRFSNHCICVSRNLLEGSGTRRARRGRRFSAVPNGVLPQRPPPDTGTLRDWGLESGRYVLQVSRFVPEKRQLDLIHAFRRGAAPGWRLVLVGGLNPGSPYSRQVLEAIDGDARVVLTDVQTGARLAALFAGAGLFVLPSSHEGLPIVLLEALSYRLPVLASDIPANRELALPELCYFRPGDVDGLSTLLRAHTSNPGAFQWPERFLKEFARTYDWERIADETYSIYLRAKGGLFVGGDVEAN